ncbi:MAG: type II secretion system GspH family protein [Candidatus Omnitrophica bacterium]|nr:type II secretion system GspH family protein [Candidatus Omnitrophota bacterium]
MKIRKRKGFTLIELLVVISIILILVSFVVPQIGGARAKARQVKCLNNLRVMGSALLMYADDNGGQFPADLADLYPDQIGDHQVFDCPSTQAEPAVASGAVTSADYVYQAGLTDEDSSGIAVVADADGNHSDGRGVCFVTGSVRFVKTADIGDGDGQVSLTAVVTPVGG